MISKTITLKCRYCGREFQQEVKAETEEKLKKEIKWYERNQLHCPHCRIIRMSKGGCQGTGG